MANNCHCNTPDGLDCVCYAAGYADGKRTRPTLKSATTCLPSIPRTAAVSRAERSGQS